MQNGQRDKDKYLTNTENKQSIGNAGNKTIAMEAYIQKINAKPSNRHDNIQKCRPQNEPQM